MTFTINWCQCLHPPHAHSKHSLRRFNVLLVSVIFYKTTTVLEVIELEIFGAKSIGKPGKLIKLKKGKELQPVLVWAREAAGTMITLELELVRFPNDDCIHHHFWMKPHYTNTNILFLSQIKIMWLLNKLFKNSDALSPKIQPL